ncbi:MAG: hypothetical protein BWY59_00888 [Verrucomicrobia bacterium ADurb.Bin345]|nr:MAG: hypothetical protein BWY59_00888 [Verrucomicrobia bacterium ADurb.Bin345]
MLVHDRAVGDAGTKKLKTHGGDNGPRVEHLARHVHARPVGPRRAGIVLGPFRPRFLGTHAVVILGEIPALPEQLKRRRDHPLFKPKAAVDVEAEILSVVLVQHVGGCAHAHVNPFRAVPSQSQPGLECRVPFVHAFEEVAVFGIEGAEAYLSDCAEGPRVRAAEDVAHAGPEDEEAFAEVGERGKGPDLVAVGAFVRALGVHDGEARAELAAGRHDALGADHDFIGAALVGEGDIVVARRAELRARVVGVSDGFVGDADAGAVERPVAVLVVIGADRVAARREIVRHPFRLAVLDRDIRLAKRFAVGEGLFRIEQGNVHRAVIGAQAGHAHAQRFGHGELRDEA